MKDVILKKISENPNLVSFCNKILSYNSIFNIDDTRNMFLISMTSSDYLIDKHACDETIEVANFILHNINLFILEDDIKKDIIEKMYSAIEIAEQDKKYYISKTIENSIKNYYKNTTTSTGDKVNYE